MAKVTVLTAVYNAEPYLRQCLDSLKNQTLTDCQFICIDDCSTDASFAILQEYAQADPRFQLLQTPVNSGVTLTRKLGLTFAKGEYVTTLDADDWLTLDALEEAYKTLKETQAQCVLFQLILHHEGDGREDTFPIRSDKTEWSGEEAFLLSLNWSIPGLYMVEADMYKRFPYDEASHVYSDETATHLHFLNSTKVVMCQGKYYYRLHDTSVTHACNIRRFDKMVADESMKRQLESLTLNDKQKILDAAETHRWLNVVGCYMFYFQHRDTFTPKEHQDIQTLFKRMLPTIEPQRIPWSLKCKLGYYPFRSYQVFCFWENLYFKLRKLMGR